MYKKTLTVTAFFGAIAIILGALGAHALKDKLDPVDLANYKTAVFYQIIHVIGILAINNFRQLSFYIKIMVSHIFLTGIVLFSGSIYAISLGWLSAKKIWFIPPFGGFMFIVGWLILGFGFWQSRD